MKLFKKRKTSKKILCGLIAVVFLVGSMVPLQSTVEKVYGAETASQPVKYIDGVELNRPDTLYNMSGNAGSSVQKIAVGNYDGSDLSWYVAGYDRDSDSLVFLCTRSISKCPYDVLDYRDINDVKAEYANTFLDAELCAVFNHCFSESQEAYFKQIVLRNYPGKQEGGTFFYPPNNNTWDDNLLLGQNDGVTVSSNVVKNCYSEKFWLRTRPEVFKVLYVNPKSYGIVCRSALLRHAKGNNDEVLQDVYGYLPAIQLKPASLLFVSAASASTKDAVIDESDGMTMRFDSAKNADGTAVADRIRSSASICSNGIAVTNPTAGEYLYVQWNDGSGDKVKSFALNANKTCYMTEDGIPASLSDCRVWIEKSEDSVNYAKKADISGETVIAAYWNGLDSKIRYTEATPITSETKVMLNKWYIAEGNINVDNSITVAGNARLILADGCTLSVRGKDGEAAISTDSNSSKQLTIYDQQDSTGKLIAQGGRFGAGIGSDYQHDAANITINGGNVTATGGYQAAGIGCGAQQENSDYPGVAHNITINDGVVKATGGENGGAGIGGGYMGKGSNITIKSGAVTATGGKDASGIGGGSKNIGENIKISGGSVIATSGSSGVAGIGSGYSAGLSQGITFGENVVVKADSINPPQTILEHSAGEDCAQKLGENQYITALKEDDGRGAGVDIFMVTGAAKKSTNTIRWEAVEGADGYEVYYAKCGKTMKKVKATTGLKFTKKNLNRTANCKYRVIAYAKEDGVREYIAMTPVIHIAGVKARCSNAIKVTAKPAELLLNAGESKAINAKITKKSSSRTVLWKNHKKSKIGYISSDSEVVTVNSKGKIKAIDEGTAYVYAYAASGAFAKVKVTVK